MLDKWPIGNVTSPHKRFEDLSVERRLEHLYLFDNHSAATLYYTFMDYETSSRNYSAVERSLVQLCCR